MSLKDCITKAGKALSPRETERLTKLAVEHGEVRAVEIALGEINADLVSIIQQTGTAAQFRELVDNSGK